MPTRMTRNLALASIAALPLTLGTAWAQTETEPEEEPKVEQGTDAGEAGAGTEAAPVTQGEPQESFTTGPKRVRVPTSDTPEEQSGSQDGIQTEDVVVQGTEGAEAADEPEAAEATAEGGEPAAVQLGTGPFVGDYTIGDPDAPVQVIEYASFTCPHCAAYHQEAWDDLEADFIEPGRIGFTMREVYFDRFGLWASMAARCGGEQAFYPITDQFFTKQAEWTKAEDIAQAIADIARLNGLTETQIKACLENRDFANMLVEEYQSNREADEVTSTPTFLVISADGTERIVGNKPDELREAIEAALPAG